MKLSQNRQLIFRLVYIQDRDIWVRSFQEAIRSQLAENLTNDSGGDAGDGGQAPIYEDPPTGESIYAYSECNTPATARSTSPQNGTDDASELYAESPEPKVIMFRDEVDRGTNNSTGRSSIRFSNLSDHRGSPTSRTRSDSIEIGGGGAEDRESFDGSTPQVSSLYLTKLSKQGGGDMRRGGSTDRGSGGLSYNNQMMEAQLLQGRVSASRARGHGDSDFILLKRISQSNSFIVLFLYISMIYAPSFIIF